MCVCVCVCVCVLVLADVKDANSLQQMEKNALLLATHLEGMNGALQWSLFKQTPLDPAVCPV